MIPELGHFALILALLVALVAIWGGCLLKAFGGVVAMSDRRYRLVMRQKVAISRRGGARMFATDIGPTRVFR